MKGSRSDDFPVINLTDKEIRDVLEQYRTVAVVGLSDKPEKGSYRVARYLKEHGYRIIPVNPYVSEVIGEKSYPDLKSVPVRVDIVNIFRRSRAIPGIVDDAVDIGAKVVWMQQGLTHNEAARKARDAGLEVVQSRFITRQHRAKKNARQ